MHRFMLAILVLPFLSAAGRAQEAAKDPWAAYRFLLGDWEGEGDGKSGVNKGQFTFALELDGKILVRKNRAEVPAPKGRPAATHEDLLIVYAADGKANKAIYFDNESHVINYTPTFSQDGRTLTFLSDAAPKSPRFRLTYTQAENGRLTIEFAMAPPGKEDGFKTYVKGVARKKSR